MEPPLPRMRRDSAQKKPAFTAGGSREAEMATPTSSITQCQYYLLGGDCGDVVTLTREPALPPSTERATPAPLGTAIRTPTHSDLMQY